MKKKGIDRRDIGRDEFLNKVWEWKEHSGGQITNQLRALGASPDWDKERLRIMKDILKADKALMQGIQDNMFVFETLLLSDDKSLQTLLRAVDDELIILALKGADDELRTKLFGCMSQRAAANIQDEMEALGPVRLTEVQEAQKQIIAIARRMSDEGSIVLAGRGGDDFV